MEITAQGVHVQVGIVHRLLEVGAEVHEVLVPSGSVQ